MFRKDGYLNFSQIHEFVMQEWVADLDLFEESETLDYPSAEERIDTMVAWGFRSVVDAVASVVLLNDKGRAVEVDAWRVLWQEVPTEWAAEWPLPDFSSRADLRAIREKLQSGWAFVDIGGLITLPWEWRYLAKPNAARSALRKSLLPYRGWAVAVKEADARSVLDYIRGDGLAQGGNAEGKEAYIFDCFRKAFPDGKGKTPWREVEKRVGYSRRSIGRALKAFGAQKDGQ